MTERSLGDAVRALGWCRQFREIVLMFAIYRRDRPSASGLVPEVLHNIEPLCEPL
jgi:hypothetical protein